MTGSVATLFGVEPGRARARGVLLVILFGLEYSLDETHGGYVLREANHLTVKQRQSSPRRQEWMSRSHLENGGGSVEALYIMTAVLPLAHA
jgi:hypothetical protein